MRCGRAGDVPIELARNSTRRHCERATNATRRPGEARTFYADHADMPTVFSHAIAASAAAQWRREHPARRFWAWTVVCSMLPDIDVIGFSLGIRYDDMFGH